MTKLSVPQARALDYLANYRGSVAQVVPPGEWASLVAEGLVKRRNALPATYSLTAGGRAALASYNERVSK